MVQRRRMIGEIEKWVPDRGTALIRTDGPAPNAFFGHVKNFENIEDEDEIRENIPVAFCYYPNSVVEGKNPKAFYINILKGLL